MKKHVFVIIRYSVLTEASYYWRIGSKSFSEYKSELFDDARLNFHFELFSKVTYPSLKMAIGENVKVLIVTSKSLPDAHKSKVLNLIKDDDGFELVQVPSTGDVNSHINDSLSFELGLIGGDVCFASVRLDDDDGLSYDFFNKLSKYLKPELSGFAVTFPLGFAGFYLQGDFVGFEQLNQPKIALGLSYISTYVDGQFGNDAKSVYGLGDHNKIDEKCPVIMDSTDSMYIRVVHEGSDTYENVWKNKIKNSERRKAMLRVDDIDKNRFGFMV
ncbi:glycosyltransferase [Halomonas sp. AOP1-B1-8]|uniref:glycosyltransferase n=1 Tax=unclassified Halomonas TaxID=2609666 RepID=UPI003F918055